MLFNANEHEHRTHLSLIHSALVLVLSLFNLFLTPSLSFLYSVSISRYLDFPQTPYACLHNCFAPIKYAFDDNLCYRYSCGQNFIVVVLLLFTHLYTGFSLFEQPKNFPSFLLTKGIILIQLITLSPNVNHFHSFSPQKCIYIHNNFIVIFGLNVYRNFNPFLFNIFNNNFIFHICRDFPRSFRQFHIRIG